MQLLTAIQSGKTIALLQSRAPDQARRRVGEITGAPSTILWVDVPAPGQPAWDYLKRCGAALGRTAELRTTHLGAVLLVHPLDPDAISTDRMRAVAADTLRDLRRERAAASEIAQLTCRLAHLTQASNDFQRAA